MSFQQNQKQRPLCSVCHQGIDLTHDPTNSSEIISEEGYIGCKNEHYAHRDCIKDWIIQNPRCPICQEDYDPSIVQEFDEYKKQKAEAEKKAEEDKRRAEEEEKRRAEEEKNRVDPDVEDAVVKANQLVKEENYGDAIDAIWDVIDAKNFATTNKNQMKLVFSLAIIYKKMGKYALAIQQFNKLVKADPTYPKGFDHLAECYDAVGMYDKAEWARDRSFNQRDETIGDANILGSAGPAPTSGRKKKKDGDTDKLDDSVISATGSNNPFFAGSMKGKIKTEDTLKENRFGNTYKMETKLKEFEKNVLTIGSGKLAQPEEEKEEPEEQEPLAEVLADVDKGKLREKELEAQKHEKQQETAEEPSPAPAEASSKPPQEMPPEQSAEPAPEQSAEPAPEQSAEPAPEQSAEPAPESAPDKITQAANAEPQTPDQVAQPSSPQTQSAHASDDLSEFDSMMADMDKLSQSEAAAQSTQTTDTAGKAQKPKKKKRKSMFSSETLGSQRAEEELGFDLGIDDGSNTEQDQIESPQQSAPESVAQPSVAQPPTGQQADVQGPDELDDFNAFLKDLEGEGAASQGSQGDAQVANAQKQDVDSPSGQLEKYKLENECRKNGIDFNIEIQNIDQKAQEIAYQQGAMEDLLEKAQDAFTEDKITIEEYQQQEERISQQIETFQKQINLLQRLRNFKLKQSM